MKLPVFASLKGLTLALTLVSSFAITFHSLPSIAALELRDLSQEDFDKVIREVSANTSLHSVTAPSSLGSIFGFELGVVGGLTRTPEIDALAKEASSSAELKNLPHAALIGAVTVPGGITAEVMFLPKISAQGLDYQQYAAAVKWTLTDHVIPLPVNIAARGFMAKSEFSFKQVMNDPVLGTPVDTLITSDNTVMGAQLLVSPKLIPIIEPYIGVGYVSAKGKMNVSGNARLFDFTNNQSAESQPTSSQLLVGADIRLLLIGIGAEYTRAFGTDSVTAKFSLKF